MTRAVSGNVVSGAARSGLIRGLIRSILLCFSGLLVSCQQHYQPSTGDIIFHTSRSAQSLAVQQATGSRYSHMGVVYVESGRALVFEAVQPVTATPLDRWIKRGEGGHFVVKRLRNAKALLDADGVRRLKEAGQRYRGKPYDRYFEWSDTRIYCSELVYKMYLQAFGLKLGQTQTIADFDLSSPAVKAKIRERWKQGPPKDERVISPVAVYNSTHLVTVHQQ